MVDDCIYVPTWKPVNIEHPWISLNISSNHGWYGDCYYIIEYKGKEINSKPQNYMNQEGRVPGLPDSFSGVEARSGGRIQLGFYWAKYIWGFPKMVVPNNHGFSYQKWSVWGVLGIPPFKETPIWLMLLILETSHSRCLVGFTHWRMLHVCHIYQDDIL